LKNFIDQKNEELIKFIINRKHNQFILITPSHKFFLHSQLGQFNAHFQSDFQKVYLNSADIKTLNLTIKEKVVVSANGNQCEYFVEKMDSLKPGVALIYSGTPFISTITPNVNFLTSGIPESSEHSGSYNSNFIEISKIT
jgi:anaerobic selenocysteine-containing dehydrogenase